MAETLHDELKRNIPLSEMIESLRMELKIARDKAVDDDLKLKVKEIELELRVAVGQERQGGGGIKFWVVNAEAGGKATELATHVFRLKLEAEIAGGKPDATGAQSEPGARGEVYVSDTTEQRPR